ncbi:hypothetical protein BC941DRAFT_415147 [Chlamydoabsidia padenii]|nr:hypothetical protein BC941DRAFT_415147 [Chlamydoabsidia padenii]
MCESFNDDYVNPPFCKREYSHVENSGNVTLKTKQLLDHSPQQADPYFQHRSPLLQQLQQQQQLDPSVHKRIKQENLFSPSSQISDTSNPLTQLELDSIFNFENFQQLPREKQEELARLLPAPDTCITPTTSTGNNLAYPSSRSSSSTSLSSDDLITTPHNSIHSSFFSPVENPVFWSALDDWQLMLASGQMVFQKEQAPHEPPPQSSSPSSSSSSSSSLSPSNTSYKDDGFELYWGILSEKEKMHNVAGDSKSITLKDMCRKGLIRENDVIVYKRNFSACKVVVSKTMKVIRCDGSLGLSIILDGQVYEDFETPTALETMILDHHGEVAKDKRPNGNAFKSIRLLRDGKDLGRLFDIRKEAFGS